MTTGVDVDPLQLIDADQLSRLLNVKKAWIYDAVEAGQIRALRLGRQLRFRRCDIERYLEERVAQ